MQTFDLDEADLFIDRVLGKMGRTRNDFEHDRIKRRSEWDRAHQALTGASLAEIREWQSAWQRAVYNRSSGPSAHPYDYAHVFGRDWRHTAGTAALVGLVLAVAAVAMTAILGGLLFAGAWAQKAWGIL